MEVTLVSQTAKEDFNCSTLQVRKVGGQDEVHTVHHYRLTCWPHQGVPKSTKPILDFLRYVVQFQFVTGGLFNQCSFILEK